MNTVFSGIYEALQAVVPVYPSFDAVPLAEKPRELFSVLEMGDVSFSQAAVTGEGLCYPFEAVISVRLLAPAHADFRQMMQCFYESVLPAVVSTGGTFDEIRTQAPYLDLKLRRMVFGGTFTLRGTYHVPAAETEASA